MASRILGVTFETYTQARPGAFSVPQAAATLLGIGSDDPVELRIIWEGGKLEVSTRLRPGLEIYPRSTDETTVGLDAIPSNTPITVTVWRTGESPADGGSIAEATEWTDERFDEAFQDAGGDLRLFARMREWARDHSIQMRYGRGRSSGPLNFEVGPGARPVQLFNVGANGSIGWVFRDNLDRAPGLKATSARVAFVRRIGELFDVDRPNERADTWLEVSLAALDKNRHDSFFELIDTELEFTSRGPSDLMMRYQRVLNAVLDRFKQLRPNATGTSAALPQNWLEFAAGRSGFLFAWSMARSKYFRVELYIDVGAKADNKRFFDALRAQAGALERAIGQGISWERLDEKRGSRVAIYYQGLRDDFGDDGEMVEWGAETMARMVDVLRPIVRRL